MSHHATKEVVNCSAGLHIGYKAVKKMGLLTLNTLLEIQATLESNQAGFRKVTGTVLKNEQTGEIVYTPPKPQHIPPLMDNLEQLIIQEQQTSDIDPLAQMAIFHHQIETIHPFYNGNGRTGCNINILYLIKGHLY